MESQFACAVAGAALGYALRDYAQPNVSHLRNDETRQIEERVRADLNAAWQRTTEQSLEAERNKTEHRVKRECSDKYRIDTKRRERELIDARRERDSAKALRDGEVERRFESNSQCRTKDTEIKRAHHMLKQCEAKCSTAADDHAKTSLDLKRERTQHATTQEVLVSLRKQHQKALHEFSGLQAHIHKVELTDAVGKDKKIAELQKLAKKLERQDAKLTRRTGKLEAALKARVEDVDALVAEDKISQSTIATLRGQLEQCHGQDDMARKYEAEKRLREAAESKYSELKQEHDQCHAALASANEKTKDARDGVTEKIKVISQLQGEMKKLQDEVKDITKQKDDAAKAHAKEMEEADAEVSRLEDELKKSNESLAAEQKANEDLRKQLEEPKQASATKSSTAEPMSKELPASLAPTVPQGPAKKQVSSMQPSGMDVDDEETPVRMEETEPSTGTSSSTTNSIDVDMVDGASSNSGPAFTATNTSQPTLPPKPTFTAQQSGDKDMVDAAPIAPDTTKATTDTAPSANPFASRADASTSGSGAVPEAPLAGVFPTKEQVQAYVRAHGGSVHFKVFNDYWKAAYGDRKPEWTTLMGQTVKMKNCQIELL